MARTTEPDPRPAIEALLLPGTPEKARRAYLNLPNMARVRGFGPLEEDVVVLDTETTGLSFSRCELIEIAAARISGREVVARYHTFVHPHGPIPEEIKQLTGITDVDVADAPNAVEAVRGLAEFVEGDPVLAHNALFDRTFIQKVPGGDRVTDMWVDTLSLSRIALPCLSSHRLASMAEAFGCDTVTHRAMDDVDALCGMWRIMLCGLLSLPDGLCSMLANMRTDVAWPLRPILSYVATMQGDAGFSLKQARKDLIEGRKLRARMDADDLPLGRVAPTAAEVANEFGPGGSVERMYARFERRPEQLQMTEEVRSALATSSHRAIEAGTGVGKSVAYLVPLIQFAKRNNVTVGVATKTNALTDQLVSHELPGLAKVLPGGVEFCSLKGYEHYPCLRKVQGLAQGHEVDEASDAELQDGGQDLLTAAATILSYAAAMPEGDLDALGIRWRNVPRKALTTTPRECQRTRCPFFRNECLVHGARARAASSDVVVTNHSLLLLDIASGGRVLPPIRHWVVDEAHSFEAEARRQWAVEVCGDDVRAGFEHLGDSKSGTIRALMVQTNALDAPTLVQALLVKTASAASRASRATGDLFQVLHELVHVAEGGGGYDNVSLWIDETVRSTPEWGAVLAAGMESVDLLDAAAKAAGEAGEKLVELGETDTRASQMAADLGEASAFLATTRDAIRLVCDGEDESYVFSAQLYRQRKRIGQERLEAQKLDVGADLASEWFPQMHSVVMTSATMAVRDDFSHFDHAVGLDRLEGSRHRDVRLDSSFDYDNNMQVIVVKDLPQPNDGRYLKALEDALYDVHVAMGGSVLTLFTNRREMEQVYENLAPRLGSVGLGLVRQEKGSSARQLRNQFMAQKTLSLMALKSFWEGFDAAGDTLRCVVIPKLPFANPRDPLVRERDLREQRSWWRYSLPEAVLAVKQAAGRLIRTSTDTGVLVLMDSRLVQKGYGRDFLQSLPARDHADLEARNVSRYITLWRQSHER